MDAFISEQSCMSPTSHGLFNPGIRTPVTEHKPKYETISEEEDSPNAGIGKKRVLSILVYGIINAIICIPVEIGWSQVIFRDPFFKPYLSDMLKLLVDLIRP